MYRCLLAFALVAGALPLTRVAIAAPTLEVKARPWIDTLETEAIGGRVQVTGTLRDNLNQSVPGAEVEISVANHPEVRPLTLKTNADGVFSGTVRVKGEGRYTMLARFSGSSLLGPAEQQERVYVGRITVQLQVDLPPRPSTRRPVLVPVTATLPSGAPAGGIPIESSVDGVGLKAAYTDPRGRVILELPAPTPRAHRLDLQVPEASDRLPTSWSGQYYGARPLEIALVYTGPTVLAPGVPLTFKGQVNGAEGESLDVLLIAGDRPVAQGSLDDEGRFSMAADPDDTGSGSITFRALTDAGDPTFIDGASETVTVEVPPPPPPSPLWTWVPLSVAILSMLVALWRWRPRPSAPRAVVTPEPTPAPLPAFEWQSTGAKGPPVIMLTDGLTGAAIPGVVYLLPPEASPPPFDGQPPEGVAGSTLPAGESLTLPDAAGAQLWITSPGYAPGCHRCPTGSGRAVIRLLPVRAQIQKTFMDLLARAGQPVLRFGRETPAQAGQTLIQRGWPQGSVNDLVRQVDRACFGGEAPDLHTLEAIATLARRLEPAS
ncbi:MAG: hypothetical protein ACE366_09605 [Bradymonadia bacterium]